MQSTLALGVAVWLVCSASQFAPGDPLSSAATAQIELEVLNNTQGVNLRSYLQTVEKIIKNKVVQLDPRIGAPAHHDKRASRDRVCHSQGRQNSRHEVSLRFRRCGARPWRMGRHHCFQPVAFSSAQFSGSALALRVPFCYNSQPDSSLWVRVPEQVRLSEILIAPPQPSGSAQIGQAQHRAQELLDAIRQSGRFADVAQANSQGPTASKGGDLGYFDHGKLAPSIEEIAFQLKVGDVPMSFPQNRGLQFCKSRNVRPPTMSLWKCQNNRLLPSEGHIWLR
jgi:parvulin-like peptidyl-prolyl isomerase